MNSGVSGEASVLIAVNFVVIKSKGKHRGLPLHDIGVYMAYNSLKQYMFSLLHKIKNPYFTFIRRFSLRLTGYKRPPFLLWQKQRKEISDSNFFIDADHGTDRSILLFKLTEPSIKELNKKGVPQRLIDELKKIKGQEYLKKDKFLNKLNEIINKLEKEKVDDLKKYKSLILQSASKECHYAIYLYPDRLRWHFWLIGLIFAFLFFINGNILASFTAFVWMVFIIPFIVFRIFERPVLNDIWSVWATALDQWLKGVIQYGHDSPQPDMCFLRASLPPISEPHDSVYWSPAGSEQESFLKAAILDMYPQPTGKEDYFFHETALKRFAFYWCSPIWESLAFLSVMLFINVILSNFSPAYLKYTQGPDNLIMPLLIWFIYSMLFLWNEANQFKKWTSFKNTDYLFLPPAIQSVIDNRSLADFLTSPRILTITNFIVSAIVALYLVVIAIVSSTSSIYNSGLNVDDPERFKSLLSFIYKVIWFIKNTLF